MGGGLGRVTKHPDYYLSDGSISFLTGNTLFRVHKSFFERESKVFCDLFAEAAEDDPQSGTDACPYTLDGVTPEEFERLLWVWYDREYCYQRQPKENWVTILRLSKRWEFQKIKELAIRELEALELPPAERISIYNEHEINGEQLISSYVELCKSPTVPTAADGQLMQMETLIRVLQAREGAQRKAVELGHESPTSASLEDETLREIVSKFFGDGLNPRSGGTSTGSGGQASTSNGPTITVGEPQVPDRRTHPTRGPTSHPEQAKVKEAESNKAREEGNLAKAKQDKEREEREQQEKAKKKEEEERAKQAKQKEEEEKAEKAKQDKGGARGQRPARGTPK